MLENLHIDFNWKKISLLTKSIMFTGVFVSSKVNSFRPYPYVDEWDYIFLLIQGIWFLVLCYIILTEVRGKCTNLYVIQVL